MQTPPIEKLPRRPRPAPGLGKIPPQTPPPRQSGKQKPKDGKATKSEIFIYGCAVGAVMGQLMQMALQEFLAL